MRQYRTFATFLADMLYCAKGCVVGDTKRWDNLHFRCTVPILCGQVRATRPKALGQSSKSGVLSTNFGGKRWGLPCKKHAYIFICMCFSYA